MIEKLIEQQETIKGMQENEKSAIKIMKMYEDYKLRVDKAIEYNKYFKKTVEEQLKLGQDKSFILSSYLGAFHDELYEILKGKK